MCLSPIRSKSAWQHRRLSIYASQKGFMDLRQERNGRAYINITFQTLYLSVVLAFFALTLSSLSLGQNPQTNRPVIPKTWDAQAIASFQTQLADPRISAKLISSSYYY